jgi:adenylosuccinate lyase
VREAEEPFAEGQKGSSAMPHKRNPIVAERITGLARLLRGYAVSGLEDVALWHERDISHSSVERVVLPDACCVLDYALDRAVWLVGGLRVFPQRMRANLDAAGGLAGSSAALLALVDAGWSRERAYAAVQRAAMAAWEGAGGFRDLLLAEPGVAEALAGGLDAVLDPARFVAGAGPVFERLQALGRRDAASGPPLVAAAPAASQGAGR